MNRRGAFLAVLLAVAGLWLWREAGRELPPQPPPASVGAPAPLRRSGSGAPPKAGSMPAAPLAPAGASATRAPAGSAPASPAPVSPASPAPAAPAAPTTPAPVPAPAPPASPAPASSATRADATAAPDLSTPRGTVATQIELLRTGARAAFARTFMPAVVVAPEAFDACRGRLAGGRVQPDWETAEDTTQAGHRVRRVSMFGKAMTGFHEIDGRWLADALWCLPPGP